MKKLFIITLLNLGFIFCYGQQKQCFCNDNEAMKEAPIRCETILLKNKSKLYWQFNCNKIWLTLQNNIGKKIVINEVNIDLYNYVYRLGFQLIKEYKDKLLFRSGCSANGPCVYTLINKSNGQKFKEFNQLICIDTDIESENPHNYKYNFLVYLSDSAKYLNVFYVDTKKVIKVPFKYELTGVIPNNQFSKMEVKNNILTLYFEEKNENQIFKINLNNKS
ncbi:hypothetical protein [Flavobacterium sp.]|uniref:hypothetical protein n=1 Tax=Flavobacterium sp. TaxID=239 RepID=UPI00286B8DB5|nr:hypothetical protein [Flavobacterium sp.]